MHDDFLEFIEQQNDDVALPLETGAYECMLKCVRYYDQPFPRVKFYLDINGRTYYCENCVRFLDGTINKRLARMISTILKARPDLYEKAKEYTKNPPVNSCGIATFDVLNSCTLGMGVVVTADKREKNGYTHSYILDLRMVDGVC